MAVWLHASLTIGMDQSMAYFLMVELMCPIILMD